MGFSMRILSWKKLLVSLVFLAVMMVACTNAPKQTIIAAQASVMELRHLDCSGGCEKKLALAESHLKKAHLAMAENDYEEAKKQAFWVLRLAGDAHKNLVTKPDNPAGGENDGATGEKK